MDFLMKVLAIILSVITPLVSFITSDRTSGLNDEIAIAQESVGGFMKGVCHLEPDYELIKEGNIGWYRTDIPFPYNSDGSISNSYIEFKEYIRGYVEQGIKIFAITPYPDDYIEYGLDPRDDANTEAIQDIARFFVEDLDGLVSAFQVTNEMGIDRFTLPLTLDEAAKFIGIQLEAMYLIRGNKIIGYNLGGLAVVNLPFKMMSYHKYCDYVGLDLYLGSFEGIAKNIDQYIAILNYVRLVTQKPIILCEFGYMGYGEAKTDEEKTSILQSYGYDSEEDAKADINGFIANLPESLKEEITTNYSELSDEEKGELVFGSEYSCHIYRELPGDYGLTGYAHTPEGQGKFYEDIIPKVMDLDYVIGMFVYCWEDSDRCYVCGQSDCPVETGWGLVDGNGNPKPSYYAVQKGFE